MAFACPNCGSRKFRLLHPRTVSERFAELFGGYRLRCTDCGTHYENPWTLTEWLYAKCPKCCRTDLSFWSRHYYRPPAFVSFLIALGAHPYRCNACRHNFASFRKLKARYQRSRTKVIPSPTKTA